MCQHRVKQYIRLLLLSNEEMQSSCLESEMIVCQKVRFEFLLRGSHLTILLLTLLLILQKSHPQGKSN